MTLTIALDCGCRITLVSEGDQHRPAEPRPCARHVFIVSTFLTQLVTARVRVGFIQDDAPAAIGTPE